MAIFFHILSKNIIPIFAIIALGFALDRKFKLNIFTLSKINFYVFTPAFIFVNLYSTSLGIEMLKVAIFCAVFLIANDLLGRLISKVRKFDEGMSGAFKNSIMFNNSGNIGLSLITLVFGSAPYMVDGAAPYLNEALAAQIIVLVVQNMTSNTLGFYYSGRGKMNFKDSVRKIFTMPTIYAIPLALMFKYLKLNITVSPLWSSLVFIKDGLVPTVLVTLGVQLSKTEFNLKSIDVHISAVSRLIGGPLLAFALIKIFGFSGVAAQTLFIAYSVPTAVNTALIAVECDNNQGFAAQAVMMSTVMSTVTLVIVIYTARALFPL